MPAACGGNGVLSTNRQARYKANEDFDILLCTVSPCNLSIYMLGFFENALSFKTSKPHPKGDVHEELDAY
jgi:hypothetical protein